MPNEVVVKVRSAAAPETVYRILADPERAAEWLGPGSTFQATPESVVFVPFPHSAAARGVVSKVVAGKRVEFSWGYEGNAELPPGSSRVVIELEADGAGTLIVLRHTLEASPNVVAEHEKGWRHYAAAIAHASLKASERVEQLIADYHRAWNAADVAERRDVLARCWAEQGTFRDSMGSASGRTDLAAYIDAARRFAPGVTLERAGGLLFSGSSVLYAWRLVAGDSPAGNGYNVVQLGDDGLLSSVTGFWAT